MAKFTTLKEIQLNQNPTLDVSITIYTCYLSLLRAEGLSYVHVLPTSRDSV
jgi:hypothetical protein